MLCITALGWLWVGLQLRRDGMFPGQEEVAISFAALWLLLVLLAMPAWDLFVAIGDDPDNPSLGFGPQRSPKWLSAWLVPAAFLIGMVLGHKYWS